MTRPYALVLLCALPAASSAANFSQGARGTQTGEFLTLAPGARAAAMGEAYSAVADEATALYWNPAAMTRIPNRSAALMHAEYLEGSWFDYASFGQNLGAWGAVGLGAQYFSAGDIPLTDASGADLGKFRPYGFALSLGYANTFHDIETMDDLNGVSVGISAKLVRAKITEQDTTHAFDFGLLTPEYLERLRFAFTIANMGRGLRFDTEYGPLPLTLRFGSVVKLLPGWIVSGDIVFPRNNRLYPTIGTEYVRGLGKSLSFAGRAGFNAVSVGDIQGFSGVSFGAGATLSGVSADYAFLPFGGLGQAHRVSLTFRF